MEKRFTEEQIVRILDVNYAEDQLIARAMLIKGYIKAYNPIAKVFHSHDYGVSDYYRRNFQKQTS